MKRGIVKVVLALSVIVGGMAINSGLGYATLNRAAWGCAIVREADGGPVVLVKIHDNPTIWDTQFVNGVERWECGDNHGTP